MKKTIVIIEDEEDIVELLRYNLERESFHVYSFQNGEKALASLKGINPSLVVLDLMLPGMDGFEVLTHMKRDEILSSIPIIILTAKTEEATVITGLELGADDYITKPFSPKILLSRIKVLFRRQKNKPSAEIIEIDKLLIDGVKHKVFVDGKDLPITHTEFKLLKFMAERPGIALSRDKLLDHVFGYDSQIYDRTVDAHIKSLRKKLGKAKDYIETIRGVGYRFKEIPDS